ncbi:phosphoribosyltransferase [Candidatus Omnitrophota bacterium]
MFDDRRDAGRQLGKALEKYKEEEPLVLAIPRGGVEVGSEVAKHLDAEFSIIVARKLQLPDNPEAGFGAIAEDGSVYVIPEAKLWLDPALMKKVQKEQKKELERRIKVLKDGKKLPRIKGRTVILVDDGIAMGSTVRSCVMLLRNKKAAKIIVAAPVSGREIFQKLQALVDDVVILNTPPFFTAVATSYRNWYDVSDEEVMEILKSWE